MSIFKSLKQKRRFSYLLLWFGAGLVLTAYYLLVYIPEKEEIQRARHFRVLERIGHNLSSRFDNYQQQAESYVQTIYLRVNKPGNQKFDLNSFKSEGEKWNILRNEKPGNDLEFVSIQQKGKILKGDKPLKSNITINNEAVNIARPLFVEPLVAKEDSQYVVNFSANLTSLFYSLQRPEVFEHFLVLQEEKNYYKVIYSSFSSPVKIGKRVGTESDKKAIEALPSWLQDTSGLQITRSSLVHIQGKPYYLFLQPVNVKQLPDQNLKPWVIAGAVPKQVFNRNTRAIPSHIIETLSAILLFALLLLPFLKLIMIRSTERLHKRDILYVTISMLLGVSLYIILSATQFGRSKIDRDLIDNNLKSLSNTVNENILNELNSLATAMRDSEEHLSTVPYKFNNYKEVSIKTYASADTLNKRVKSLLDRKYSNIDYILWLNQNGEPLIRWDLEGRVPFQNLAHREYFKQAKINPSIHIINTQKDLNESFGFESIISYSGGGRVGVLTKKSEKIICNKSLEPSKAKNLPKGGSILNQLNCYSAIQTIAASFRSLQKVVLPEGYSFCLIDRKGEVLFHSNESLNLSENIIEDCEPASLLQAAISANQSVDGKVIYQGRNHWARISPLRTEDKFNPIQTNFFIVVFAEQSPWNARQMHAATISVFLVFGFQLILLLMATTLQLIGTNHKSTSKLPFVALDWCWIKSSYNLRYFLLGLIGLLVSIILIVFDNPVQPLRNFARLLLAVIYFFLFNFLVLCDKQSSSKKQKPLNIIIAAWQTPRIKRILLLGLFSIFIFNSMLCYWLLKKGDFGPKLVRWFFDYGFFQIFLIVLFVLLFLRNHSNKRSITIRFLRFLPYSLTPHAYSFLIVIWLLILSILPAYFAYQAADIHERALQNASLIQSIDTRKTELGKDIGFDYSNVFLLKGQNDNSNYKIKRRQVGKTTNKGEVTFYRLMRQLHNSSQETDHKLILNIRNGFTKNEYQNRFLGIWPIESTTKHWWLFLFFFDSILSLCAIYYIVRYSINRLMLADLSIATNDYFIKPTTLNLNEKISLVIQPGGSKKAYCNQLIPEGSKYVHNLSQLKEKILAIPLLPATGTSNDPIVIESFEDDPHLVDSIRLKTKLLQGLHQIPKTQWILLTTIDPKDFIAFLPNDTSQAAKDQYRLALLELLAELKDSEVYFLPVTIKSSSSDQVALNYHFTCLWHNLTREEKYLLFDLAQDGIVNAKNYNFKKGRNSSLIGGLIVKGLIINRLGRLFVFNDFFRAYILTNGREEVKSFEEQGQIESEWESLQGPILVGILIIAGFLFLTQRDAFNTFQTLIVALTGLLPLLPRLFAAFTTSKVKSNS